MSFDRVGPCILLILVSAASAQTSQPTELQRGEFHTTFTERSPLSSIKEITRRFGGKPPANADYDLATQKFAVYVPKDYDPATPCGLIVFRCYKHSEETAPTLHDIFDKDHLIFAVTHEMPATPLIRIGTSLDAVYNLSKMYKIDPNRVWVIGDPPAQELAIGFPDVFVAAAFRQATYFRPVQSLLPNSGMYASKMSRPIPEYIGQAKQHRLINLLFPNPDDYHQVIVKAFAQDGFKQMMTLEVSIDAYHYPNFETDWFEKVVAFLDVPPAPGPLAGKPGTSRPAAAAAAESPPDAPKHAPSAPAAGDPQKMLNLAKSYIAARSYTAARTRLNAVIEKFPDDPAAAEAKQLLGTLPPP